MISIHMESSEQYITGYYLYCCCSLKNCNLFKFSCWFFIEPELTCYVTVATLQTNSVSCCVFPLCVTFFLVLCRIHEICCLDSLSKLNMLDLHDNQVLFLYRHPSYRTCILNSVNLVASGVKADHGCRLQSSV